MDPFVGLAHLLTVLAQAVCRHLTIWTLVWDRLTVLAQAECRHLTIWTPVWDWLTVPAQAGCSCCQESMLLVTFKRGWNLAAA